jgi:hypothetical protein
VRLDATADVLTLADISQLGPELTNPQALADVRFGAHYGLKSDIARGPKTFTNGDIPSHCSWPHEAPVIARCWERSLTSNFGSYKD